MTDMNDVSTSPLRLLILGAHPDDAEVYAGGLAANYRDQQHLVKIVSVTDGGAGHYDTSLTNLNEIRRDEAAAAAGIIGAFHEVWDFPDGSLEVSLRLRDQIIREIRSYQPDLVLTHRTCDYHPDHRAVGQAVQDASYMVTVPRVVPEVPALRKDPVVAYMTDLFTKPCPLAADVLLDVTPKLDTIVAMLTCHRSQFFDWLPYNQGILEQVPDDEQRRTTWLREWFLGVVRPRIDRYHEAVVASIGEQASRHVQVIEVYEISEYAGTLSDEARQRLFPVCDMHI